MKKLYERLQPYKFRIIIFALLSAASFLSVILYYVRTILSGSYYYNFLVENLFLAWIPFWLANIVSIFAQKRSVLMFTMPVVVLLWVLFFPNAPYILTDFLHLSHPRPLVPLWFDLLLLIWFAVTGLLLGVVSLFLMQDSVSRHFGRVAGWVFVFAAGVLCGFGIYIGRFLEFNSWDIVSNPYELLHEFTNYVFHPNMQPFFFISVFSTFFIFFYVTIYTFGLLLHEQAPPVPREIA